MKRASLPGLYRPSAGTTTKDGLTPDPELSDEKNASTGDERLGRGTLSIA